MEENLMEQATQPNEGEQTSTEPEQQGSTDQAQEQQQDQQQEQEEVKAPEGAPEKYELKAPEGEEFDSAFLKTYEETARELNLTNEAAQKMIDKLSPVLQQQTVERIEAIRSEWAEASKSDKEFGGAKLNENLAVAKTALDKFGTPELKQLINDSGIGNHPELIRFFYRAGKAITPDDFVCGHQEGKAAPKNFNEYALALYSN